MRPRRRGPALLLVLALLAAAVLASVLIGANPLSPARVWHALAELRDPVTPDGVIVADRVRRTVIGVVIGACLAAAGAAMQGVTRNPLGDPGILGINAGAAATVVLGITLLGISGTMAIAVWALIGDRKSVV